MTTLLAAASAGLLAVCALGAWYFLVALPRRWRVPLRRALALVEPEPCERADLEAADQLLDEAMNASPRGRDLADARFAHAFVRAMLGVYHPDHYWTAAAAIDGLAKTTGYDPASAHLALWLQHKLERHERAVELYQQHADVLTGHPSARRTAAASHLHLAGAHWRRRETDEAMHHFDRVRELGELTDKIPKAADNLHVLKGIQAFFDHRHADARTAFEAARERAAALGQDTVEADLGLLACDWPAGDLGTLEERLAQIAAHVAPSRNGLSGPEKEYRRQLSAVVALLRLVLLLRTWAHRPPLSGAPDAQDRTELERRAHALRDIDPELGDAHLVEGLLRYYFAVSEDEREAALALLEEGMKTAKGIIVPEVLQLVEKERALGGQGDALSRFLRLVHEFLADPSVSVSHREELRSMRDRFARHADDIGEDMQMPHRPASPYELRRRIDAVRRRVMLIVHPRLRDLPDDAPSRRVLQQRLTELGEVAESFTERADALHQSEHKLVMNIGEFLLPQEEWEDDHAAVAAQLVDPPDLDGMEGA